ncbi:MAG: DUF6691 family protein [Bacteroidota bacterium]
MKHIKFILVGILFGVTMYMTEAVSWFRIFEMFKFQAFHMYGIIGTAIAIGIVVTWIFKSGKLNDINGNPVKINDKAKTWPRYIIGGIIFGLGWGLSGLCPGMVFILIGAGNPVFIIFMISILIGTFMYGVLRTKIPH